LFHLVNSEQAQRLQFDTDTHERHQKIPLFAENNETAQVILPLEFLGRYQHGALPEIPSQRLKYVPLKIENVALYRELRIDSVEVCSDFTGPPVVVSKFG